MAGQEPITDLSLGIWLEEDGFDGFHRHNRVADTLVHRNVLFRLSVGFVCVECKWFVGGGCGCLDVSVFKADGRRLDWIGGDV